MINIEAKTEKFFKKLEKDMSAFRSGIGTGLKDYADLGFKNIRERGFIFEVGVSPYPNKPTFKPVFPRANKADKYGRKVYHKSKIVNRQRGLSLARLFQMIRWSSEKNGDVIMSGKVTDDVRIDIRDNKSIKDVTFNFLNKYDKIFKIFEYGRGAFGKNSVQIDGLSEKQNAKIGQRRVVSNGLRAAANRINKAIKLGVDKRLARNK